MKNKMEVFNNQQKAIIQEMIASAHSMNELIKQINIQSDEILELNAKMGLQLKLIVKLSSNETAKQLLAKILIEYDELAQASKVADEGVANFIDDFEAFDSFAVANLDLMLVEKNEVKKGVLLKKVQKRYASVMEAKANAENIMKNLVKKLKAVELLISRVYAKDKIIEKKIIHKPAVKPRRKLKKDKS